MNYKNHLLTANSVVVFFDNGSTKPIPVENVMYYKVRDALDDMLNKVALVYEDDVDNTVDNLGKILEPFIILFLGTMIGGLVVSMYLPIFNLMNVIG